MEPLALRPEDAAKTIGRSRGRIYELIASGELPSFKDGTSRLIAIDDLRAWVERRRAESCGRVSVSLEHQPHAR